MQPKNDRRIALTIMLTIIAAGALATSASATDRYYHDVSATSPDGRFQLDAKSPNNAEDYVRPFADDFTYSLTDTKTDRVIWTRRQDPNEPSPVSLFLHDDMWVVIRTSGHRLLVLEPVTGRLVLTTNILDHFPEDEQAKHVHWTTAGKMWSDRSHWYFLEHDGAMHFIIRSWWDRRVIADLSNATVVEEPDASLLSACNASEREFVLATLEGVKGLPEAPYAQVEMLATAVHLAGRLQAKDAVPLLREVERSNYVGSLGSARALENFYKEGDINPFYCSKATLRQSAQLALRRLGEKPAELPCTWFRIVGAGVNRTKWKPLPAPRADRVELLEKGMTARQVLDAIGPPDFVRRQTWDYDMDTDEPYTLRLHWPDRKTIDRWERITPPLWQQGETRYGQLG